LNNLDRADRKIILKSWECRDPSMGHIKLYLGREVDEIKFLFLKESDIKIENNKDIVDRLKKILDSYSHTKQKTGA
jgi:hypothetical protein